MWYQKKGSKFGAISTLYEGNVYHSKKEAGRAKELDLLVQGKAIKGWDRQKKLSIDSCGKCKKLCSEKCSNHPKEKVVHICNYYIDFVIYENDGTITYEEVKGFQTDIWRMKWKLAEIIFGDDEEIRLVVVK